MSKLYDSQCKHKKENKMSRSRMCPFILYFVFYYLRLVAECSEQSDRIDIGLDKQFVLGGLFPVHGKGPKDGSCGPLLESKGIQRLEAMLYALDKINSDSDFSTISIGATILDTCSSDAYALEQSLQFLKMRENLSDCKTDDSSAKTDRRVTAVIGAANSPVSESVASILRLFQIPQVSYASTSEELDDVNKYPYFYRVVPSDTYQIDAMLDLLSELKWTYISAIAAEDEYGKKALDQLRLRLSNSSANGICFSAVKILRNIQSDKEYETVIDELLDHGKAKAVVVFLNEDKLRRLLAAAHRRNAYGHFLWLGSDSWGTKTLLDLDKEHLANGAITILPKRYPIEEFNEYFLSLKPHTNNRNPWFQDFWEKQFDCRFLRRRSFSTFADNRLNFKEIDRRTKKICTGNEDLKSKYRQEGLVPKVIDAVYVIAHALRNICENDCSKVNGSLLKDHIAKVRFNSSQKHNMVVQFDSNRQVLANYTIYQYRKEIGKFDYEPIGEWNKHKRLQMSGKPIWPDDSKTIVRKTSCSAPCRQGQERVWENYRRCCWTCRDCEKNYFLENELSRCTRCPRGEVPNSSKTGCRKLEPLYMGSDWGSPWTVVPCFFSCLGILSTLTVLLVFQLYKETPLIKAAGRELCYIMLVGVLFCYVFTFVVASRPTKTSCGVLRIGLGLGLSICYSSIFTKTNRISRIFNRQLSTIRRPSYISPTSQIVICLSLVLIQITLTAMWLIVHPPTVTDVIIDEPPAYIITCGIDTVSVQLGLIFNMLLVLLCTVYAYKTRNIPENFNEAKYISFTMYSSCIVWLAFVAIYSSTWKDLQVQTAILCMSVSMSGTVVLLCLFFPKLYIVLLKPHKNVRNLDTTTNSANATDGTVRFVRPNVGNNNLAVVSAIASHNSCSSRKTYLECIDNVRQ